jgi:SulP family sulfate permease
MVHALVLFIILLAAGPLAAHVPLAALAGVLVMVAYHMSEWRSFRFIFTGTRSDVAVLLVTFFLTVLMDLTVAVGVGLVLASFLFMHNMAELTQVKALTYEEKGEMTGGLTVPEGVEVYSIHGSFFFGAVNKLMEVETAFFKKPKALVLEMRGVLHLDTSGLKILEKIHQQCQARGTRLVLVGIHAQPLMLMQFSDKYKEFGEDNFKGDLAEAFADLSVSKA